MLNQLMNLIAEYRLVIMTGSLLLLILGIRKKTGGNRLLLTLIVLLAGSIIYELVMNEPVTRLPVRIDRMLNQPGPTESSNPRYYISPEKRQSLPEGQKGM